MLFLNMVCLTVAAAYHTHCGKSSSFYATRRKSDVSPQAAKMAVKGIGVWLRVSEGVEDDP
jgi:hypothetical protein